MHVLGIIKVSMIVRSVAPSHWFLLAQRLTGSTSIMPIGINFTFCTKMLIFDVQ